MLLGCLQLNRDIKIADKSRQTSNVLERLRGLLGRPALGADECLWITRCNSVHTFFMRYPIDVVFINARGMVLKVCCCLSPWRMQACLSATAALEFRAGEAERLGIFSGSQIEFLPNR